MPQSEIVRLSATGSLPSHERARRDYCCRPAISFCSDVINEDPLQENGVADESAEELYEQAPCGYLSTTPEGRIVRVNQTFAELIGMEPKERIRGMRFSDLLTIGGRIFYETHFALMLRMHREVSEIALDFHRGDGTVVPSIGDGCSEARSGRKPSRESHDRV